MKNPENAVVGQGFNRQHNRPLQRYLTTILKPPTKQTNVLKMDAKWTDKVESGKPVTVNFDGTLVTAHIGKEQVIGKDELIAKWGSQDENDQALLVGQFALIMREGF